MNLLCPTCYQPLNPQFKCANNHAYSIRAGVLELLEGEFRQKLETFTQHFSQLRAQENRTITNPNIYPKLPGILSDDPEWRQRTYDLSIINQYLARKSGLHILDIGAWNGWLSHRLAEKGHIVTAIDYFADPHDGLRASQFYPTKWNAIQMNLDDLSILDAQFDVIILNRCVQFFCDPPGYAVKVQEKLASGGMLILTGLAFFRDPRHKIKGIHDLRAHLNTHGFDFFKEIKGYLDHSDMKKLQKIGVRLYHYPQLTIPNLKSFVSASAPSHFYGICQ